MVSTVAEVKDEVKDPTALGGPVAGLSFVAGIAGAMAAANSQYPRPWAKPEEVQEYFGGSAGAARLSAAGQLVSSAGLLAFLPSVADLAGRSGKGSRLLRTAAVTSGAFAAVTQAVSALASAALTTGDRDLAATKKLHKLVFLSGGPVHSAGLGVLAGALGLAGLRTGELPKPLSVAGLVVAPVGLAAPLSVKGPQLAMAAIPASRFTALIVSGIAGAQLARKRR